MNKEHIVALLQEVQSGKCRIDDAMEALGKLHLPSLEISQADGHRMFRNNFSEVIFCEGKELEHLCRIIDQFIAHGHNVFGTRLSPERAQMICERFSTADYDPVSRTLEVTLRPKTIVPGKLAIICAGTADVPVAEEARRTAEFYGIETQKFYDVGVAGLHRLLASLDEIRKADVAIVIAGMEGALPSVVGGLIPCPIIAVPTSVGYGTHLNGFTPLFAMLSSCAEGISVVNVDNGFGAACAATRIFHATSNANREK
ncbi:MAG: nickel pincer cofactor biosynthesis protein LarB [Deltaproteobacteria bacterium]|nr:nickel pincer cofactor biosynthesis protein LarB [Deltaproteobacteria bacterium]